jgi:hypothetical protein
MSVSYFVNIAFSALVTDGCGNGTGTDTGVETGNVNAEKKMDGERYPTPLEGMLSGSGQIP